MKTRILAVDCATKAKRVGLAAGWWAPNGLPVIDEVIHGADVDSMAEWLADRCDAPRVALGLDAPLGWPRPMTLGLAEHVAGEHLPGESNHLFRRDTDRFVHETIGKLPLDVGADRIARTAHSALELLAELRQRTGRGFELPLSPGFERDAAIETYPGGTLHSGPWDAKGYKGRDGALVRERLISDLAASIRIEVDPAPLIENDDLFDAAIAALGVADFLNGICFEPHDTALSRREGWIWVRRPEIPSAAR